MSVIFNEPGGGQTLSNPSQQNNVFQFVQTTKPTERSAGVALVAGDRWYKTDDGTEWFWNGTYWLGEPFFANVGSTQSVAFRRTTTGVISANYAVGAVSASPIFVYSLVSVYNVINTNDSINYWSITSYLGSLRSKQPTGDSLDTFPPNFNTSMDLLGSFNSNERTINRLLPSGGLFDFVGVTATKIGSPGEIYIAFGIKISRVFGL